MPSKNIKMMDITSKMATKRVAIARGKIEMSPATIKALVAADLPKGDALSVAKVAGITAAKLTPNIIPMCHPILIENIDIDITVNEDKNYVDIMATVEGFGKTGYEMEALTAVSVTALTIYDMCKSVDVSMKINNIRLVKKSGGKSGTIELD